MSINSLAAIVSDNDGSAFVTKAEFEAMKADFLDKVDTYNDSISSKIDGAVAAYLAGLKTEKQIRETNLLEKINDDTHNSHGFMPMVKELDMTKIKTQEPVNGQAAIMVSSCKHSESWGSQNYYGTTLVGLSLADSSGTVRDLVSWVDRPSTRTDAIYLMLDVENGKNYLTNKFNTVKYLVSILGNNTGWGSGSGLGSGTLNDVTFDIPTFKNENTGWSPVVDSITFHHPTYRTDGAQADLNVVVAYIPAFENTETSYVFPVAGSISDTLKLVCLDKNKINTMTTAKTSVAWNARKVYFVMVKDKTSTNWTNSTTGDSWAGPTINMYYNYHPYEADTKVNTFINKYISELLDMDVYYWYGLPIVKADAGGDLSLDLTLESVSGGDIYFALSKNPFSNNANYAMDSDLDVRNTDNTPYTNQLVSSGTKVKLKMTVKENDIVWLKCYDSSNANGEAGAFADNIVLTTN